MSTDNSPAVLNRLGQFLCALQGHDEILEFDDTRMFLRCLSCGHETPGWDVRRRPLAPSRPDAAVHGTDAPQTRRAA